MVVEKRSRTEARKESCSETTKGREPQTPGGAHQAAGGAHEPAECAERRHRAAPRRPVALPKPRGGSSAAPGSGLRRKRDRAGRGRVAREAGRPRTPVIAIDWGTTSFRAYRLNSEGLILDTRNAAKGILAVPAGKFAETLEEQIGDWRDETPIVMSGMVGSRQGWVEAPYVPCPAGFDEIAGAMRKVSEGVWI